MARAFSAIGVLVAVFALAACGGGADMSGTREGTVMSMATAAVVVSEDVSRETALGWPARFCRLKIGMTREQVRSIMGPPTRESLGGALPSDSWTAYQFNVTVFFEDRAQVTDPLKQKAWQLEPDTTDSLNDEDRRLFPCGADTVFA